MYCPFFVASPLSCPVLRCRCFVLMGTDHNGESKPGTGREGKGDCSTALDLTRTSEMTYQYGAYGGRGGQKTEGKNKKKKKDSKKGNKKKRNNNQSVSYAVFGKCTMLKMPNANNQARPFAMVCLLFFLFFCVITRPEPTTASNERRAVFRQASIRYDVGCKTTCTCTRAVAVIVNSPVPTQPTSMYSRPIKSTFKCGLLYIKYD